MRHAILMTVYKDVELINRIISSYPSSFDLYIHIDKKSDIKVSDIKQGNHIHVIKEYKVNWGGYNHVKAMLMLLRMAMRNETPYDYFHWVTGQDIPVSPQTFDERIKEGYSYLEIFKLPRPGWCEGGLIRYQIYGFYDLLDAKKPYQASIIRFLEKIQKKIGFMRPFRDYTNIYEGSGYFTLYKDDAVILDAEAPKWEKFYKHTFCGEESLVQTVLMNSERKPYLINRLFRYIEWNKPWNTDIPPRVLTIADYDSILKSDCLFCRKVDGVISASLLRKFGI